MVRQLKQTIRISPEIIVHDHPDTFLNRLPRIHRPLRLRGQILKPQQRRDQKEAPRFFNHGFRECRPMHLMQAANSAAVCRGDRVSALARERA